MFEPPRYEMTVSTAAEAISILESYIDIIKAHVALARPGVGAIEQSKLAKGIPVTVVAVMDLSRLCEQIKETQIINAAEDECVDVEERVIQDMAVEDNLAILDESVNPAHPSRATDDQFPLICELCHTPKPDACWRPDTFAQDINNDPDAMMVACDECTQRRCDDI